jgi:hypothetical protein
MSMIEKAHHIPDGISKEASTRQKGSSTAIYRLRTATTKSLVSRYIRKLCHRRTRRQAIRNTKRPVWQEYIGQDATEIGMSRVCLPSSAVEFWSVYFCTTSNYAITTQTRLNEVCETHTGKKLGELRRINKDRKIGAQETVKFVTTRLVPSRSH